MSMLPADIHRRLEKPGPVSISFGRWFLSYYPESQEIKVAWAHGVTTLSPAARSLNDRLFYHFAYDRLFLSRGV